MRSVVHGNTASVHVAITTPHYTNVSCYNTRHCSLVDSPDLPPPYTHTQLDRLRDEGESSGDEYEKVDDNLWAGEEEDVYKVPRNVVSGRGLV